VKKHPLSNKNPIFLNPANRCTPLPLQDGSASFKSWKSLQDRNWRHDLPDETSWWKPRYVLNQQSLYTKPRDHQERGLDSQALRIKSFKDGEMDYTEQKSW